MTKKELFFKLSKPNNVGETRWVYKTEFIGEYEKLNFNNGCPWLRNFGYEYELGKENGIWKCRLIKKSNSLNRPISKEIRNYITSLPSSHSGLNGTTNDSIIPDHKNGRYNEIDVLSISRQKIEDFQPLTNRENLFKRQQCKECKNTNIRFDAKKLGYSVSFIKGNETYDENIKCEGCYWFDCNKFKNSLEWK